MDATVRREVSAVVRALYPGARAVSVERLRADSGGDGETTKALGYGRPLLVRMTDTDGRSRELVLHTATANDFGHDRRADRAAELLLAWDTFNAIPQHVRAVDVGAVRPDGSLISLREGGEFYLITEYVPGRLYAEDLRRVAQERRAGDEDLARIEALARYLARLHTARIAPPMNRPAAYRRAIRDLVGHGECIFGMVDGYGEDVPGAPPSRLQAIERRCLEWRWRLRGRAHRLRRTHGDFHPFNIVFQEGTAFRLLDASRGSRGDPADDIASLAVNFPFFALGAVGAPAAAGVDGRPDAWSEGLGPLWRRFFAVYLEATGDDELLEVVAPFLAFRGLVVCSPRFYPALSAVDRDRLLGFVEQALDSPRFDPASADALFR